ncbi:MAG: 16S rRNA (cytidine(1402)-2'-O)-methyltransferase [Oscillospiraceae bacterium]|nr:16S rRNA (cytidine(1402)-2'-O)-methyltransferase [Oscillospiraceae bacterium]
MNGKLYIVATPIGNLGDMTQRAVDILRECDIIAAEDTQNSMTILTKFEIKSKLVSNHKFNEANSSGYFIRELLNGRNIAIISDAGTPCISDPGYILVRKASENNIDVIGIPGACAAVTAVSISGFDVKSFVFEGFFPRENSEIKKITQKLKNNPGISIFYESPKRIIKTFEIFAENLPDCNICLCNDLTKKFEKIYRGSPVEILRELEANPSAEKGEYTIVAETVDRPQSQIQSTSQSIESVIVDVMIKQKCTVKDAINYIASDSLYNFSKNEVYAASLNIKKMFEK